MSDTTNDPQPVDPPVNTGGGSPTPESDDQIETQKKVDPPVNTGGGG